MFGVALSDKEKNQMTFLRYFFSIVCFGSALLFFFGGPVSCVLTGSATTGIAGLIIGALLLAAAYTLRPS